VHSKPIVANAAVTVGAAALKTIGLAVISKPTADAAAFAAGCCRSQDHTLTRAFETHRRGGGPRCWLLPLSRPTPHACFRIPVRTAAPSTAPRRLSLTRVLHTQGPLAPPSTRRPLRPGAPALSLVPPAAENPTDTSSSQFQAETLPNNRLKLTKAGYSTWIASMGAGCRASLDTFPRPVPAGTIPSAFAA
jgi:hypothetical protein